MLNQACLKHPHSLPIMCKRIIKTELDDGMLLEDNK